MPTVQIKDEHRIGTEARFTVEPSAYLRKLYESGTPDLGWMKQSGEWGMHAQPSSLGLRLKDVEIGSYGVVPERGGPHLPRRIIESPHEFFDRWFSRRGSMV